MSGETDHLSGTFSNLQYLLKLSYSDNEADQQKAAMELAKLVDGTVFPAVSFGPLAHALCRLVQSQNRTVATYSARALKILILDDVLRPQAYIAGVPAVVCGAIQQWEDEILCLRELLGALQTLTWDKQCVKGVLQADIISNVLDYIKASDQELAVLALATLANILSYSDTLLLGDSLTLENLGEGMATLIEILKNASTRPHGVYAAACIANASHNPRLAGLLNQEGGLQLCREIERQSLANLHIIGSKQGECMQTAVYKLSDRKEGDAKMGTMKYTFKWGTQPVMELSLAAYTKHSSFLWLCFALWIAVVIFTFLPVLFY